jgi:hypothetical protein
VKLPDPLHPDISPRRFQVPEIVLLFGIPCSTRVFVPFVPDVRDWIVNWNPPLVTPFVVSRKGIVMGLWIKYLQGQPVRSIC